MTFRTFAYGGDPSQMGDLHLPDRLRPPVVCLLHGGFWRMPYGRDQMTPLATDLASRGYAAWNLEYRRIGGGGGWPATFEDVSNGIDHLATLVRQGIDLDLDHVTAVGHSAGGHLALWAAGRHRIHSINLSLAPAIQVVAAVGQAPAADLLSVHKLGLSQGVATELLGGTPMEVPERFALASPCALLPMGVPQLLVHGAEDDVVPPGLSRAYAAAASAAGDAVVLVELSGTGHFEHLNPQDAAWAAVLRWLEDLPDPARAQPQRASGAEAPDAERS